MRYRLTSRNRKPRAVVAVRGATTGRGFVSDALSLLMLLLSLGGCGPALSKGDLGTVVFEVPKVAGSDEPYLMPQLGPPMERKEEPGGPPLP